MFSIKLKKGVLLVLCILFLILFSQISFGIATQKIKTGYSEGKIITVYDDDNLIFLDIPVEIDVTSEGSLIYLKDLDTGKLHQIYTQTCEMIRYMELCVVSGKTSSARIIFHDKSPNIEMETYLSKTEFLSGEIISKKIELTNDGNFTCFDCHYIEQLHDDIFLTKHNGSDIYDHYVEWIGDIEAGETHIIEYSFSSFDEDEYVFESQIFYETEWESIKKTKIDEIESEKIIDLVFYDDETIFMLNNEERLNLGIRRFDTDPDAKYSNLTLDSVEIIIPHDISIISRPTYLIKDTRYEDGQKFKWSGKLHDYYTSEFWFDIIPLKDDDFKVTFNVEFLDGDTSYLVKYNKTHKTGNIPLVFETNLDENLSVNTNDVFENYLVIENPSYEKIENIELIIDTEFYNKTINIPFLDSGLDSKIKFPIQIPTYDIEKNLSFNYEISYDMILNGYTNHYVDNYNKQLSISPVKDIKLIHNVNIDPNDPLNYLVDVFVESLTYKEIKNIEYIDVIPDTFFVSGETSSVLENLDANDLVKLVSYQYKIPDKKENITSFYTINSVLSYNIDSSMRLLNKTNSFNKTFIYNPDVVIEDNSIDPIYRVLLILSLSLVGFLLLILILFRLIFKSKLNIPGLDSIKKDETELNKDLKYLSEKESDNINKQNHIKLDIINFNKEIDDLKKVMAKEIPVTQEKRKKIEKRENELLSVKSKLDSEISKLKAKEDIVVNKLNALSSVKGKLIAKENTLKSKLSGLNSKLSVSRNALADLLKKEENIENLRKKLSKREIKLLDRKAKILSETSLGIVATKEKTLDEKMKLNKLTASIDEELYSISHKKNLLVNEHNSIIEKKQIVRKEINVFDADKEDVKRSLKLLKSENKKIKQILDDLKK